jgi:RHS repeat-associated protein
MAGISSKALNFGQPKNKKKFISQELDDDLGLNWYQFRYRNHDPQIGRFVQIDPLSDKYEYNSTYAYAENKVGRGFDLEGLELSEFNVNRDIQDVRSGKITADQLRERQEARGNAQAAGIGVGIGIGLSVMYPNQASLVFAAEIFGFPSPGKPTSLAPTLAAEAKVAVAETEAAASELKSSATVLEQNAAKGKEFEKTVVSNLAEEGHTNISEQITIKAQNGAKTRVDVVSTNPLGKISLIEAKASASAGLTKGQKAAHPVIEASGGVVVGKGKPPYTGGTVIPPTKVEVVRPKTD